MRMTHTKVIYRGMLSLAVALLLVAPARAATPEVVVSLPPLQSLVAGVMAGVGTPHILLRGGRSPHDMALRPSDIRKLNQAALVVWVGPGLEYFLVKPLATLNQDAVLALYDAPGVTALPRRAGGAWGDDHAEGDRGKEDSHGHGHDHGGLAARGRDVSHGLSPYYVDSHIWLSPDNARAIVRAVAARLRARDPANATAYAANELRVLQRIAALDDDIRARLAAVRRIPYIVFHDAYQYFERQYGLAAVGAITVNPQRPPSAQRLSEIRRRIAGSGAVCVFREPQFPPRIIDTIIAGTDARIGVLDPLGADIPPGPDHWFTLMKKMAGSLAKCIKPRP